MIDFIHELALAKLKIIVNVSIITGPKENENFSSMGQTKEMLRTNKRQDSVNGPRGRGSLARTTCRYAQFLLPEESALNMTVRKYPPLKNLT